MSFDALNNEIKKSGGDWVKLTKRDHGTLEGRILDVEIRDKQFNGQVVVSSKTGKPRKEWVFTLEVDGETKKFAANESAQFAIRSAVAGKQLAPNGRLKIAVTKDSVQGQKSAEYKAAYQEPEQTITLPDDDGDDVDF